jgi:hypothetical protein
MAIHPKPVITEGRAILSRLFNSWRRGFMGERDCVLREFMTSLWAVTGLDKSETPKKNGKWGG